MTKQSELKLCPFCGNAGTCGPKKVSLHTSSFGWFCEEGDRGLLNTIAKSSYATRPTEQALRKSRDEKSKWLEDVCAELRKSPLFRADLGSRASAAIIVSDNKALQDRVDALVEAIEDHCGFCDFKPACPQTCKVLITLTAAKDHQKGDGCHKVVGNSRTGSDLRCGERGCLCLECRDKQENSDLATHNDEVAREAFNRGVEAAAEVADTSTDPNSPFVTDWGRELINERKSIVVGIRALLKKGS